MKDFLRENLKVIAIFAAAAFALSLLVGLFSGNPFGVVFLRALLLAVFFAIIGAGLTFTVKRYLPELAGTASSDPSAERAKPETHAVDITLPPEEPSFDQAQDETADEEKATDAEELDAEEATELSGESPASDGRSADLPVGKPEAYGAESLSEESARSGEPLDSDSMDGSGLEAVEADGTPALRQTKGDLDGLESLPDLADLGALTGAGGPGVVIDDAKASEKREPPAPARATEDADKGFLGDEDPESLAKAIRTVMKRDERG